MSHVLDIDLEMETSASVIERRFNMLDLRPQFFSLPPSIRLLTVIKRIPIPPSLRRITKIRLLYRIRHDDDKAEVFPRNRVVKIICFGAKLEVLLIVRCAGGLTWRRVLERS